MREYKNHKCIRIKIFKPNSWHVKPRFEHHKLYTQFEIKAMENQDFRTFTQEI